MRIRARRASTLLTGLAALTACAASIAAVALVRSGGPAAPAPAAAGAPQGQPAGQPPDAAAADGAFLPLDAISPQFLGMYRKAMTIETDVRAYARQYGVDYDLARAMLIQESGGNPNLTSIAGAGGYFQVMPATFRSLRVETNVEAGIKYLSQMIDRFEREDYAVAAYNGGPSRARRGRPPLETLQYVLSVGAYRNVLKLHEDSVRQHALLMQLEPIREGDDWWSLSQRTGVSILQLRMHNPFLATRRLRVGQSIAYPREPRPNLLQPAGEEYALYRARLGDNYLHLAFVLGLDRDAFRDVNDLWHLQTLPAGQILRLPIAWEGEYEEYAVQPGDDLQSIAERMESTPWRIIRDNRLFWDDRLVPGTVLQVRPSAPTPAVVTHRVARGDTLIGLARRHGTTVRAIQDANGMGRRTRIRIGERLRIPTR